MTIFTVGSKAISTTSVLHKLTDHFPAPTSGASLPLWTPPPRFRYPFDHELIISRMISIVKGELKDRGGTGGTNFGESMSQQCLQGFFFILGTFGGKFRKPFVPPVQSMFIRVF